MGRFRARRRLVSATLALAAVPAGATTVLSPGGSDEQLFTVRTPVAVTPTRTPHHVKSPVQSTPPPGTASPEPAAVRARAGEILTGYLALLHGRGTVPASRHVAAPGLLRELRRDHPRVTPMQQQTRSRIVDLSPALASPGGARVVTTVKERGSPPYPLQLYLERRGARWVVTRIAGT